MLPYTSNTLSIKIRQEKMHIDDIRCSRIITPDDFSLDTDTSSIRSKSRSIPISNGIHRSPSEIQLSEDQVIADYRDYCMFSRIVDGITRQSTNQDLDLVYENDACLANIKRTRFFPPEESQSLESRQHSLLHKLGNPEYHMQVQQPQAINGHDNMVLDDDDEIFVIDL